MYHFSIFLDFSLTSITTLHPFVDLTKQQIIFRLLETLEGHEDKISNLSVSTMERELQGKVSRSSRG